MCNGACVSAQFDDQNCGVCGHVCGCGHCAYGSCVPTAVVSNVHLPEGVAAVGDVIYYARGVSVTAHEPDGGEVIIATNRYYPEQLVTDGEHLLWSDYGSTYELESYDLDSGAVTVLDNGGSSTATQLVIANGQAYWSQQYSQSGGDVAFASFDGGATEIPVSTSPPTYFAVDANNLYYSWSDFGSSLGVFRANLDGGGEVLWVAEDGGNDVCAMAEDTDNVYWLDCSMITVGTNQVIPNGMVRSAAKATGADTTWASGLSLTPGGGYALLVQGGRPYWVNGYTIQTLTDDGGMVNLGSSNGPPVELNTDGRCLYWADPGTGPYNLNGNIWRGELLH